MTPAAERPGSTAGSAGEPIRILVSGLASGRKGPLRWRHKRDPFLMETLAAFVTWVLVCPEVDCGLPRSPGGDAPRGRPEASPPCDGRTGEDHTERMVRWAGARLDELSRLDLCGYICKKDSPSSG